MGYCCGQKQHDQKRGLFEALEDASFVYEGRDGEYDDIKIKACFRGCRYQDGEYEQIEEQYARVSLSFYSIHVRSSNLICFGM